MLDSQLSSGSRSTKAEVGFNFGVLNGKIGLDKPAIDDLVIKLQRVESSIRKHDQVGTIERPARWIDGAGWAIVAKMTDARGAIFYFLRTETTYLALGGSPGNLISATPDRSAKFGLSFATDLVSSLRLLDELPMYSSFDKEELARVAESGVAGEKPWAHMIYHQCHHRRNQTFDTSISFLARRILETDFQGKRIILASPLYVEDRN